MIIRNARIVTINMEKEVIQNGYVVVEGSIIKEIGQSGDLKSYENSDKVIDAEGKILLPGLINLHNHPCASLLRATGRDMPLEEWVMKVAIPMISSLSPEILAFGSRYQAAEQLLTGTTTSLVHTVNINDAYSFEQLFRPAAELGLRQIVAKELRDAPKKPFNPEAPIPKYARPLDEELKLAREMIKKWDGAYGGLVRGAIAIEAGAAWLLGNATSEDIIKKGEKLARELNVPITCHISATPHIAYKAFRNITGKGEIEYLDGLGVLSDRWIFVHSLNLTDDEIKRISDVGARIAHCPMSNAYSADGVARLPKFLEHDIRTGLGTDGCYVCGTPDMFEVMSFARLIQNAKAYDPSCITPEQSLELATIGAARVLGLEDEIGSIEVGKKADFILIDPYHPAVQPIIDLPQALVHSVRGTYVTDVFVNGKMVVDNGKLVGVDQRQLAKDAVKYSDLLIAAAGLEKLRIIWYKK